MPAVLKKERWIQGPKCQRYNFIESVMNKTLFMLQSTINDSFATIFARTCARDL